MHFISLSLLSPYLPSLQKVEQKSEECAYSNTKKHKVLLLRGPLSLRVLVVYRNAHEKSVERAEGITKQDLDPVRHNTHQSCRDHGPSFSGSVSHIRASFLSFTCRIDPDAVWNRGDVRGSHCRTIL